MLGCPAYEETSFETLTAKGRNKALQAGLAARDMEDSVWACTLCGYCDAICPKGVENVEIVLKLRRDLNGAAPAASRAASRPLVLGCTLRERAPELIPSILEFLRRIGRPADPEPDGCCGALDVEAGRALRGRAPAGVVCDPVCMERHDADFLGALAMSHLDRFLLKPPFYYFAPHRLVNGDHARYYPLYDALRRATGCETNLDLNRLARSTSAGSLQGLTGKDGRDVKAAVERLLRHSKAERVITCSPADYLAFRRYSGRETRFVTECLR
jgi:ferredoxin